MYDRLRRWQKPCKDRRASLKSLATSIGATLGVVRGALRNLEKRIRQSAEYKSVCSSFSESRSGSDVFRTLRPKTFGGRTVQRLRAPYRREIYVQRRANTRIAHDLYAQGVGHSEVQKRLGPERGR